MKRVWIYCSSTHNDEEDFKNQYNVCENLAKIFAKSEGWKIVGSSKGIRSHLDFNKDGLNEVLSAAEQHKFDILLINSLFIIAGRDEKKLLEYINRLKAYNVKVFCVDQGEVNIESVETLKV